MSMDYRSVGSSGRKRVAENSPHLHAQKLVETVRTCMKIIVKGVSHLHAKSPECVRGSGVEGVRESEGGSDGREGEGAPDPWK